MNKRRSTTVLIGQIALLICAVVVFYVGLVIGLTQNPNVGTLFWGVAALLFGLDVWWFLRPSRNKQQEK